MLNYIIVFDSFGMHYLEPVRCEGPVLPEDFSDLLEDNSTLEEDSLSNGANFSETSDEDDI